MLFGLRQLFHLSWRIIVDLPNYGPGDRSLVPDTLSFFENAYSLQHLNTHFFENIVLHVSQVFLSLVLLAGFVSFRLVVNWDQISCF